MLLSEDDEDEQDEITAAAVDLDASADQVASTNVAHGATAEDVESDEAMGGSAVRQVVLDGECSARPFPMGRRGNVTKKGYMACSFFWKTLCVSVSCLFPDHSSVLHCLQATVASRLSGEDFTSSAMRGLQDATLTRVSRLGFLGSPAWCRLPECPRYGDLLMHCPSLPCWLALLYLGHV